MRARSSLNDLLDAGAAVAIRRVQESDNFIVCNRRDILEEIVYFAVGTWEIQRISLCNVLLGELREIQSPYTGSPKNGGT